MLKRLIKGIFISSSPALGGGLHFPGRDMTPGGIGNVLLLADGIFGTLLADGISYLLLSSLNEPDDIAGLSLWLSSTQGISGDYTGASPDTLGTLVAWYKSDTGITKDGSDKVSQWNDQSINGNHLVQVTADSKPLWVSDQINSLPAIRFDGTDDFMQIDFGAVAQPFHIFMVVKNIAWPAGNKFIFDGKSAATVLMGQLQANNALSLYAGSAYYGYIEPVVEEWIIVEFAVNGASSVSRMLGGKKATGNPGANSLDGITLGGTGGGTSCSNIDIAEVLVYDGLLDDTNRMSLEDYLLNRYGLGSRVAVWSDLSDVGNSATQPTLLKRPIQLTNQVNSLPSIRMDQDDDYLMADGFSSLITGDDAPFTIVMCARSCKVPYDSPEPRIASGPFFSFGGTAAHNKGYLKIDPTPPTYYYCIRFDGTLDLDAQGGTPDDTWHVIAYLFSGTTLTVRVDGVVVIDESPMDVDSISIQQFTLGAYKYQAQIDAYGAVEFAEVIGYDSALGADDIGDVERYLTFKYGL